MTESVHQPYLTLGLLDAPELCFAMHTTTSSSSTSSISSGAGALGRGPGGEPGKKGVRGVASGSGLQKMEGGLRGMK